MQPTVTRGPFRFSTKGDLDQARIAFKAQAASFNSGLIGASINGQSYQFVAPDNTILTREEYGDALADAYCQLGITDYGVPSPRTSSARLC